MLQAHNNPKSVKIKQNPAKFLKIRQNTAKSDEAEKDASLSSYSEKDKVWDVHRSQAVDVEAIYAGAGLMQNEKTFQRYAERMNDCANLLRYAWRDDPQTGESKMKLREAQFCRVRYCPTCQWRRSQMQQARFIKSLPAIVEKHPKHRWLLLTLTVQNCPITELRETLFAMNKSWQRFIKRPEFQQVTGWVRSTEVTRRGKDGSAHPHFHCLLMVPPSFFNGKNYVTQARWTELWQETAKLEYKPVVDVRAVRGKKGDKSQNTGISGALEVLKYAVKPSDMTQDPAWFLELTKQTNHLRFLAAGGSLKTSLRDTENARDTDMVHAGDSADAEGEDDGSRIAFNWRGDERRYRRFQKGDK